MKHKSLSKEENVIEEITLGSLLSSHENFKKGMPLLEANNFASFANQEIFSCMQQLYRQGKQADIFLLCENLKQRGTLQICGGAMYLTSISQIAGTSEHIIEHISQLKMIYKKRCLLEIAKDLSTTARKDQFSSNKIFSAIEKLQAIESKNENDNKIHFLNEIKCNYLLTPPPRKEMLFNYENTDKTQEGFLPKGIVALMVGAGGVGKTTILTQMALAIASGTPFLNKIKATKNCGKIDVGSVFLGLGENQMEDIHRTIHKASSVLKTKKSHLEDKELFEVSKRIAIHSFFGKPSYFIHQGKPTPCFYNLKIQLKENAPKDGWSLLIFDPISRILGADAETDSAAATQFIALMEELCLDLPGKPTVLLSHHVNKASLSPGSQQNQSAARGSSALTDGVRWQCNYAKKNNEENLFSLKITKSNFTKIFDEILTKKDSNGTIGIVEELNQEFIFS